MHAPTPTRHSDEQPPPVLASLISFLRPHFPFSGMDPAHLQFLAKRLRISYYPRGTQISGSDEDVTESLHIVKHGRVAVSSSMSGIASGRREYGPGDCFVTRPAAPSGSRHSHYRTLEDTFCLELEREGMKKLMKTSAAFRDFYRRLCPDDDDGTPELDGSGH